MTISRQSGVPLVAIVGAPNVGKSTLFNRLVGSRRAIVTDRPGLTRDRIYGMVTWGNRFFSLCDTGGILPGEAGRIAAAVRAQTEEAIEEADALVLLVDGRTGKTPLEIELARLLRLVRKPVIVAVNKIDTEALEAAAGEYHELGFGEPVPISAEHGLGVADLLDRLERTLGPFPEASVEPGKEEIVVAVVGRPNVGKSSLLNKLLQEDRLTVSEAPGTTRDAVDVLVERQARRYRFVDTAGIRRKGKTSDLAEVLSVVVARRSLVRADVVVLVLDASEPLTAQDQTVAGYAAEAHRPLIILANKWDLVSDTERAAAELRQRVAGRFRFVRFAPLLTVSAATGSRVERLFPLIDRVDESSRLRIPTPDLNRFLREEVATGRGPKLLYITQTGIRPPSFVLFTHDASRLHFSEKRRLENRLRERFGFGSTPLVLRIRSRSSRKART